MLNEQDQLRFIRLWTAAQPAMSRYVRSLVRDRVKLVGYVRAILGDAHAAEDVSGKRAKFIRCPIERLHISEPSATTCSSRSVSLQRMSRSVQSVSRPHG